MINIRYSRDVSIDFIHDVIEIEKKVYHPQYCGTYNTINARYEKNKDTFILAFNDDQLIGYLCFLPISENLYHKIIHSSVLYDDDIEPIDIVDYYNGVNLYLLSIAVIPEYQNTEVIIQMTNEFDLFLKKKLNDGIGIKNIIASAVTDDGGKILQRMSFNNLKKVGSQYVLYHRIYS